MKKYICALFLLCVSSTIFAFTPAPGLWWNPNESGRGYAIDVQNNAIVVTVFIYDSAGNPTFYQAAGIYNESLRSFSAQLGEFHGGQCFGCAYSRPTGVAVGTLSIVFSSPENGTLYYPGGSTSIQHELYGYTNKTDYFLGEWSFTLNTSGLLGTQWVVFNGHYTGSDGTVYASGQEDGETGTTALGAYYPSGNYFLVAVADNTGYSFLYQFTLGDDRRMLGLVTIYSTGTTPSNPTEVSAGSRLLFQSELTSSAPGASVQSVPTPLESAPVQYQKLDALMQAAHASLH
jgi:hypothetical protein